jgi:hypothetical protein
VSPEEKPAGRSLARSDFEAVIRRAVELAQMDGDVDERVSEAELVRIGAELGLPAEQVRRALYEQPQLEATPVWYDRYYDKPILTSSRILPGTADSTTRRIEEYISAREYMQLVRRKPGELSFIPAEDAISRLARGLSRPGSRYHLAHARRLVVSVQSIGEQRTHVRIEGDFSEQRASSVSNAMIGGGVVGTIVGLIPAIAAATAGSGGADGGLFIALGAMMLSLAGGMAAGVKIGANRFRDKLNAARHEMDALLERAEHSDRLEPPPAPWRQSLRAAFFGRKS